MPLYEYECDVCGDRFETIQKFSDPSPQSCPKCGGVVHKLQSAPAIQFKGSGWYVTDYAKKDRGSSEKTGEGTKDTAAGGTETTGKADKTDKTDKTDKSPTADAKGSTKSDV